MGVKRIYKISNKLLLSFLIITGLLFFVGIQSIFFLKSIENKQKQITTSIIISDAILEAKYFVRSDIHILYEMISSQTNEDLAYWWGEHQFQVQFVNDQIKTIKRVVSESEQLVGEGNSDQILGLTNSFELDYGLKIKSKIDEAHNLINNKQTVAKGVGQLIVDDPKVIKILRDVASDGLASIKGLDKAKEITRKIVTDAEKSSVETVATSLKTTWITGACSIAIALIIALFFSSRISKAVGKLKEKIEHLSRGEHTEEVSIRNRDELGAIAHSLNELIKNLKKLSHFASEVGNRNFKAHYESLGDDDILGNSLLEMRNKLEQAETDAAIRRKEEEQRVYVTQGIAGLGEILHTNHNSLDELCFEVIRFLVTYLKANQAMFFQADYSHPDNPMLNLRATYAYDRMKYLERQIKMGDGMAGACFHEKQSIYLLDVPKDYIEITSGLGKALPRNIFIVPIIAEDKVEGVIEIASFQILEKYQTEMVEQMAKSIGITLSGMRTNEQTKYLLEQAQRLEKEMKIREEELQAKITQLEAELVEHKVL